MALPTEVPQQRLRMALGRDPATLDPARVRDDAGRIVVNAVYDSLTTMTQDLTTVRPAAATRWSVSADDLTWTFVLRPGAHWHDGTPVVAGDFVRAFTHLTQDPVAVAMNGHVLAPLLHRRGRLDVRAPSEDELVIRLPRPFSDLPVLLADQALAPRREGIPDPEQPVGNGPFRMVEPWAHNQFIRLAPDPGHPAAPALDEVLLPIYAQLGSEQVQYEDFRAGALDVAGVPVSEVERAEAVFGRSEDGHTGPGVLNGPRMSLSYLGFDTTQPPFDVPAARRAISLLVDRDVLVAQVGASGRLAATGIVPPGMPGGGRAVCDHCRRDLVESLALLDELDPPLAGPIVLLAPDEPATSRVASSIVTALRGALDVPVALRVQPLERYAQGLAEGNFDLFLGSWTATRSSMGGFLDPLLSASSSPLDNPGRIDHPDVQDDLDRARTAATSTGRRAAWQRAEERALDEVLLAPLYHPRLHTVVGREVSGFVLAPGPRVDFTAVSVPPG